MDKDIAIIGAGQMGSGIAQLFATYGFFVKIYDVVHTNYSLSRTKIGNSLEKLFENRKITEQPNKILDRILYQTNITAISETKIIIESISENFNAKRELFKIISEFSQSDTYIASNTSSYSITDLSKFTKYPENFIGFHFMNPPTIMQLVEVVKGAYTSDHTYEKFRNLALAIDKVPIASKDTTGFILNRILIPMINQAADILHQGIASAEDIDNAMMLGANHPIGPLHLADLIGLDTVLSVISNLNNQLNTKYYTTSKIIEEYVKNGKLGKKTGEGFFKYHQISSF